MNWQGQTQAPKQAAVATTSVAREVLQRKCDCGNHTPAGGDCSSCQKEKAGVRLQRAAKRSEPVNEVPTIVQEVLSSAGEPLDTATREFFEPRFGHDFSRVRVHTDAKAAESARVVNALAYTVGPDVVFDKEQFAPQTSAGRKLLAHELTHVLQQGDVASRPAFLGITAPHNIAEQEAHRNAQAIELGSPVTGQTTSQPLLARYEPAAEVEAETEAEAEPSTVVSPGGPIQPGQSQRRAYAQSRSFDKMYEKARKAPNYEAARDELERPVATLDRGGAPPAFVSVSQKEETVSIAGERGGEAGNIRVNYKPHWFHVLDAIEHDVAAVSSSNQLIDVFRAYFPESVLSFGRSIAGGANYGTNVSLKWGTEFNPKALDPDGSARAFVFLTAATKKSTDNPKISTDYLIKTLIQEWEKHEENENQQRRRRLFQDQGKECLTKEVDRKGGDPDHDAYAKKVTGADKDFQIVAPDGGTQCTTDGREPMNPKSVWEVKTRHEWATSYGIPGAIFAPYFSGRPSSVGGPANTTKDEGRIMKIEEQRLRCLHVTEACGFRYAYAFESKEAADFMKLHWRTGGPPVHHR